MAWDGFCITCQRTVEFAAPPGDDALPDCPVCSSPVVAVADDAEEVLWVIDPHGGSTTNLRAEGDALSGRVSS